MKNRTDALSAATDIMYDATRHSPRIPRQVAIGLLATEIAEGWRRASHLEKQVQILLTRLQTCRARLAEERKLP